MVSEAANIESIAKGPAVAEVPTDFKNAIARLVEVCETQFCIKLEPTGEPFSFNPEGMSYGSRIGLLLPGGSLDIGLFGDRDSSNSLARFVLAMDEEDEPAADEVADLFGEVVNMVSGLVKRELSANPADVQITVPMFLLSQDCGKFVTKNIPQYAQALTSADFEGSLIFVWSDRGALQLLGELAAWSHGLGAEDKFSLAQMMSLFDEFSEALGEANAQYAETVEQCVDIVLNVINDGVSEASCALRVLEETIGALRPCFEPGGSFKPVTAPSELLERYVNELAANTAPAKVERDEETLELFGEFLSESEDGLERCDEILMRVEQGAEEDDDVNALFRNYHSIKGVSSFLELEGVTRTAHATENLLGAARSGTLKFTGVNVDLVFESTELMRSMLEQIRECVENSTAIPTPPQVHSLVDRLTRATNGEVVESKRGEEPAAAAPAAKPDAPATKKPALKATLKVEEELVTRLEGLVAELEQLRDAATSESDGDRLLREFPPMVSTLREVALLIRMVSCGGMFQKMARMVRDLSKKTGKLTRLVLDGQDTKISRTILEKVSEPLVHMIRNAVDHGIEDPDARAKTAKAPMGTICLSAAHEADKIVISIKDDGKGLDKAKLRAKAIGNGILEESKELTDQETYALIFAPGFSTAEAVTDISGRGVGMDVVRRNIEAMGGKIEIDSTLGEGTLFRLVLPLMAPAA